MAIELRTDRDPKTGHFLKGNTVSNTDNRIVAHHMAKLKSAWLEAITPEDVAKVLKEMLWLTQQKDNLTVKLAACEAVLDRTIGKPDQNINVQNESRTLAANITITPDQQAMLEQLVNSNTVAVVQQPEANQLVE
jgi:hypothetical protein